MRKILQTKPEQNQDAEAAAQVTASISPEQKWKTIEQMAGRYQLSVRTIAYMAEDGRLPHYKIGKALRFDPKECDLAMKAFRRSSKFDRFIDEVRSKDNTETAAAQLDNAQSPQKRTFAIDVIIFALSGIFLFPKPAPACPITTNQPLLPNVFTKDSTSRCPAPSYRCIPIQGRCKCNRKRRKIRFLRNF